MDDGESVLDREGSETDRENIFNEIGFHKNRVKAGEYEVDKKTQELVARHWDKIEK